MKYLDRDEVLRLIEGLPDMAEDTQLHVNHTDCQAGTDTKRRLYIKRTYNGYLFYCHHCGKSGSYVENKFRSLGTIKKGRGVSHGSSTVISLPADYETDTKEWPAKARAWVYRYGITDEEITKYGIGYSPREHRVILPSWEGGELLGYQTRKIFEEDTGPKYTTYHNKKNFAWKDLKPSNILVICEDVLSAIKLCRYYASMALLSTYLHKCNYHYLFGYDAILIYLDNNNPEVKLKALSMKKELEMYVNSVKIISIEKDPKECSNTELEGLQYGL